MNKYDRHPNIVFTSKDREFEIHETAIDLHSDGNRQHNTCSRQQSVTPPPVKTPNDLITPQLLRRGSQQVLLRYQDETPIEQLRRKEKRRAVQSSPLYTWALGDQDKFTEVTDSPDYKASGLKKLKSKSWESIARWEKENEFLFALIEDESEWLLHLFPDAIVSSETFFKDIEDGVLLCQVARLCQKYAEDHSSEHHTHVPLFPIHIHSTKKCRGGFGKFMRRENVELFLKWCRLHKIPEPLLFESNDVVERTEQDGMRENAREIVLCLMEVARLGVKYGVDPPKLIQLEKEIELEEQMDASSMDGSISPISIDSGVDTMDSSSLYTSLDVRHFDSLDEEREMEGDDECDVTDGMFIGDHNNAAPFENHSGNEYHDENEKTENSCEDDANDKEKVKSNNLVNNDKGYDSNAGDAGDITGNNAGNAVPNNTFKPIQNAHDEIDPAFGGDGTNDGRRSCDAESPKSGRRKTSHEGRRRRLNTKKQNSLKNNSNQTDGRKKSNEFPKTELHNQVGLVYSFIYVYSRD